MSDLLFEKDEGILVVTFNRPAKKNALTFEMYDALAEALRAPEPDVSAIVIASAGNTFCAGNDLRDFLRAASPDSPGLANLPPVQFLEALVHSSRPLIAAVHGAAIGIGATMLLHCDLVYATPTATLEMPFVSLGLVPEGASSLLLPERVGLAVASEMLLLGTPISAQRAAELRLVNAIVPPPELLASAIRAAKILTGQPPEALRITRELVRNQDRARIAARMQVEVDHFSERLTSAEAQNAFMRFLQRKAAT